MHTVSFRLEENLEQEIEEYAQEMKIDKSTAARKVFAEGLKQIKIQKALNNLRLKRWTIWKAAEYCNESYRSMLEIMRRENVPFPLSVDDVELELNATSHMQ
jgi:predicted HTH domain antitoxin